MAKKKSEELLKNMQKIEIEDLEEDDDLEKTEKIDLNAIEEENLDEKPKRKTSSKKKKIIKPVIDEFHKDEIQEESDNNLLEKELAIINSTLHEGLESIKNEWVTVKNINAKVYDELNRVTKIVEVERKTSSNSIPVATKMAFALSGIAFILSVFSLIITSSTRKSLFSTPIGTETLAVTQRVTNKDFVEPQSKEHQSVKFLNPKSYKRLKMTKKR